MENSEDELLDISFNTTNTCFACASNNGVQVYSCYPSLHHLPFTLEPKDKNTGVGLVQLEGNNRLFTVGGGEFPSHTPNNILGHDATTARIFCCFMCNNPIRSIKACDNAIAVTTENKAIVYDTSTGKCLYTKPTISNPHGVSALAPGFVLAVPGLRPGDVGLHRQRKMFFFQAHDSHLACLAFNSDGTLLATASCKGTLIRLFDTTQGNKLQELRRGKGQASITSMAFSPDNRWLVLTSDKHTVHLFSLNVPIPTPTDLSSSSTSSNSSPLRVFNPVSSFSRFRVVLPQYFSSEWSFAQFRLPTKSRAVAVFSTEENCTIFVACYNGSFFKLSFDPSSIGGSEMKLEEHLKF